MRPETWLALGAALALLGRPPAASPRRVVAGGAGSTGLATVAALTLGIVAALTLGIVAGGPVAGVLAAAITALVAVRAVRRSRAAAAARPPPELPLILDLFAALLRAGLPLDAALTAVADTAEQGLAVAELAAGLRRVSGLLRLGAAPGDAFAAAALPGWSAVAGNAARSAESGIRLADGMCRVAAELRAQAAAAALARAQRVGVLVVGPLGLCFLPAFVCLGIVPTVVGITSGILGPAP